tara:strand:- start:510 stop:1259 length:750 start_codon:yes stop_codon:yes gene_type:complete
MGDTYESEALLNQYLLFHYGTAKDQFPYDFNISEAFDFPVRCAQEGINLGALNETGRALDLGCSVGRSTFELAKSFDSVTGIDYSSSFIQAAQKLKSKGSHAVNYLEEGTQFNQSEVFVDSDIIRERVSFECGDAQNLRSDLGSFDFVLACNLICRLPNPMALLDRLPTLVRPKGQLFITTPFTWLEEYTPRENWLGSGGEDSFNGLQNALGKHFKLLKHWDMPFLIREHSRKFQFSIAQASRWVRVED